MGAASDLDEEIRQAQDEAEKGAQSAKTIQETLDRQQADDRSVIAKMIIRAFVVLVCLVVIAAIAGAVAVFWADNRDWNQLAEPAKFIMSILGSVMLPVVTLVIGYYFGKK